MTALIKEFKSEHSKIIKVLSEVGEFGIQTKEGQAKLMSAKATLIEHLKKEDEKFYPVLLREAEQNKKLKEGLEIFAKDLGYVSSVALRIFDRYEKAVLDEKLLLDFGTLFTVLRNRMRNEENFLYGEYEKLN